MQYLNKKDKLNYLFLSSSFFLSIGYVHAHEFTSDEISLFLKTIDEIKIQGNLIQMSLLNSDTSSLLAHTDKLKELYSDDMKEEVAEKNERVSNDISVAITDLIKSSKNMSNLKDSIFTLDDVLDEAISVRIPQSAENNSTIQALRFAELINEVDKNYAKAMNQKPMNTSASKHDVSENKMQATTSINTTTSDSNKMTIMDLASYNTTKKLLDSAEMVYKVKLNKTDSTANNTEKLNMLSSVLKNLSSTIEEEKPYLDVAKLIHGTIQPTVGEIFNLKIEESLKTTMDESEHENGTHTDT